MNHKYFLLSILAIAVVLTSCEDPNAPVHARYEWTFDSAHANVASFVDPMIGTGGHGHTFPGATAPFGMVQLSPDTRIDGSWDGCSGYHYDDSIIYGFSHTHLSGTGCSDYGDIMLMPGTAEPFYTPGTDSTKGYRTTFTHENEKSEAGYYSVKLNSNILCEMTASPRVGVHRYNFNDQIDPWIVLDMSHRDEVLECELEIVDDHTIRGKRFSKAWATNQQLWFYAEFSEPFTHVLWSNGAALTGDTSTAKDLKAMFSFTAQNVEVKMALSPVSSDNARLNLQVETDGMNFDAVKEKVQRNWDSELSCIEIETDSARKKTIFYTALYHCFIAPNVYCDVNGDYQGMDHKVYRDTVHQRYTVFSLWDTYRALHPLFTIVQQKRTNDFINTFLQIYQERGRLPVWELSSNETDCMIGYHSVSVITDAWMKGIVDYDTALAYEAMKASAMENRGGLESYRKYGFIPAEEEGESVSKTIEYSDDDGWIAACASRMNDSISAAYFSRRADYWKNLFNPETGFLQARINNCFVDPFSPEEVNFHYTEANAWQYSIPLGNGHELMRMQSVEKYRAHLDSLFSGSSKTSGRDQADITGMIGQYAQGNEPSHHMIYAYHSLGERWKTRALAHKICNELYTNQPDGLCGNEDCGQMSAWYVFNGMGFYPYGGAQRMEIGSPQFDGVKIHLENGKTYSLEIDHAISTKDSASSVYVLQDSAMIVSTGLYRPAEADYVYYNKIMTGGTVKMYRTKTDSLGFLTNNKSINWGYPETVVTPWITGTSSRTFIDKLTIGFKTLDASNEIFYRLNGGSWEKYHAPIAISQDTKVETYATGFARNQYYDEVYYQHSDTAVAHFFKAPSWKSIAIRNAYAPQYSAGGDRALIDGLTGTTNFRTGLWQGYEGVDMDVTIDLGKELEVESVNVNFLHDQKSWIFLPEHIDVWFMKTLNDTTTQRRWIGSAHYSPSIGDPFVKNCDIGCNTTARYIRVVGVNRKTCPIGHPGEGKPAWLFADEITIKTK